MSSPSKSLWLTKFLFFAGACVYWLIVTPLGVKAGLAMGISGTLLALHIVCLAHFQFIILFFCGVPIGKLKGGKIYIGNRARLFIYASPILVGITSSIIAIQYIMQDEKSHLLNAMLVFPSGLLVAILILARSLIGVNNAMYSLYALKGQLDRDANKRG